MDGPALAASCLVLLCSPAVEMHGGGSCAAFV